VPDSSGGPGETSRTGRVEYHPPPPVSGRFPRRYPGGTIEFRARACSSNVAFNVQSEKRPDALGFASDCMGCEVHSEDSLAESVIAYLAEHPNAMDTLDGIAEWWIMRQQFRVDIERLATVLNRLTECGQLDRIGSGSTARYRLKNVTPQ
jgi:hypothetical protein